MLIKNKKNTESAQPKVDIFLVGAPKCGTTALVNYLSQHNKIFFPKIKEPHYFCVDFDAYRRVNTPQQYLDLYKNVSKGTILGDASVFYLYSKLAAREIKMYNPDAKIIAMLRDPISMLPSLHAQLVLTGREDILEFEEAWSAIADRKAGKRVPRNVIEASHIYYDEICAYKLQLDRYYQCFPRDNILIIDYEDFSNDPAETTQKVFDFLGLPRLDAIDTPRINERRQLKFPRITNFLQYPPFPLNSIKTNLKRIPWLRRNHPLSIVYETMTERVKKSPLPVDLSYKIEKTYNNNCIVTEPKP